MRSNPSKYLHMEYSSEISEIHRTNDITNTSYSTQGALITIILATDFLKGAPTGSVSISTEYYSVVRQSTRRTSSWRIAIPAYAVCILYYDGLSRLAS